MAIDPIAVTGGAAANTPTNTDVSAQSNAASHDGSQSSQSSAAVGSSGSIDLFNYANQQNRTAVPLDALSAEGKAKHFANPTTLGEKVLNFLEGFHERVVENGTFSQRLETAKSGQSSDASSSGPASVMPASSSSVESSASPQQQSSEDRFAHVLDVMEQAGFRHTETNLVSNVGQQFSRAMSTLMRGQ
ncbi:MAG: hypothetical protein ACR2QF_01740 [Geminicoccaceae bacterium]